MIIREEFELESKDGKTYRVSETTMIRKNDGKSVSKFMIRKESKSGKWVFASMKRFNTKESAMNFGKSKFGFIVFPKESTPPILEDKLEGSTWESDWSEKNPGLHRLYVIQHITHLIEIDKCIMNLSRMGNLTLLDTIEALQQQRKLLCETDRAYSEANEILHTFGMALNGHDAETIIDYWKEMADDENRKRFEEAKE